MSNNPELGRRIRTGAFETNVHDSGSGAPVMLIHGSGPGVSAWANWRLVIPALSERFRVVAPDMVGFGYTDRPEDVEYCLDTWVAHALAVLDALELPRVHLIGNSFGGAVSLALAARHPERVERLVLMGSVGVNFQITPGLDAVWGYEPSIKAMRGLLDIFAFDRSAVTDELAELRYRASIRPGVHESYSKMFPAPRQRSVEAMATPEEAIRGIDKETLLIHGRDDQVIPLETSLRMNQLIPNSQLHVFGNCGHWVQIEQNARFVRLVTDFLSEQE